MKEAELGAVQVVQPGAPVGEVDPVGGHLRGKAEQVQCGVSVRHNCPLIAARDGQGDTSWIGGGKSLQEGILPIPTKPAT